ncbi:uncharacterized protein LOC143374251 isoform X2 [Andrena cerasifolii]
MVNVDSEEEALRRIFEGEARRSIVKGSTYTASHLATAVITFHVSNISLNTSWNVVTTAKLHIVEMAGIGTIRRTDCCKPAADIGIANLAKTQLEQFFWHLAGTGETASHRLMRSSNLLKILGNAFPVSSTICLICHIRMTKEDLELTLSALRFSASIVRLKPMKVKVNVTYRPDLTVERLRDQVDSLKKELMMNQLFLHQEALMNISESRIEQISRAVSNFLNGTISDFTLFNVAQAQILLNRIKDLHNRLTVKECDVEKLRETYNNLLASIPRNGASAISSKENTLPNDNRSNVLRRPRISSESDVETKRIRKEKESETGTEEVGSLDKTMTGVTLGPCAEETRSEDGKEQEEEEEEVYADVDGGTVKADNCSITGEQVSEINSHKALMVRRLFERFLNEEKEYRRTKKRLDKSQTTLGIVQQRFASLIDKYFQAKKTLNNARYNLSKHQRVRYAFEVENHLSEGKQVIPAIEKMIDRDIACYEKVLMNLEGELAQMQNEICQLHEQQYQMRSNLKSGFNEYCKRIGQVSLLDNEKLMKTVLDPVEKESLEIIRRKYDQLQRAMARKFHA